MGLSIASLFAVAAVAAPCLDYGTGSIEGTLVVERVGVENPRTFYFVRLPSPICMNPGTHPKGYEPALAQISNVHFLHQDEEGYRQTSTLVGQKVTCLGTLFGKWNENHATPMLMKGTCVAVQQVAPSGAASRPRG